MKTYKPGWHRDHFERKNAMADEILATIKLNESLRVEARNLGHDLNSAYELAKKARTVLYLAQERDRLGYGEDLVPIIAALESASAVIEETLVKLTRSELRMGKG